MKGGELPGSLATLQQPPANGTHRRRSTERSARAKGSGAPEVAPEVLAAQFAGTAVEPIDAPMWPILPAGWFQPEATACAPSWSGLIIERRHRMPAPGLVQFRIDPLNRPDVPDDRCEAVMGNARPRIPGSSLEPLGWDPRALCPRKEMK